MVLMVLCYPLESAAGDYPVEACETMSEIAEEAEKIINYRTKVRLVEAIYT